jgi:IS4 transposase
VIPAAFDPFLEKAPLCVMTRLSLECLFRPERLDTLFRDTARKQYQKELLFSQVVELMMAVVLRVEPSVHAAYRQRGDRLPVSDQAVYDKLRCMEPSVAKALVADSAVQVGAVIDSLDARAESWLPGYRVRVIDGNHLAATEKRLKPLRQTWAAALPGKVLAVYEPELDLVTDVFLTPDGHAQERALLPEVLQSLREKDLWIADRNFCTLAFLFGIERARAKFVLRQHGTVVGELLGERRPCGRTDTGKLYEQKLRLTWQGQTLVVRRVTLVLDVPTRDGDTEIHILTNLSASEARAAKVAELYRKRWTIEGRFYEVTQTLDCEPNTLGYPKAALFAFCLALVASNAVALLRASLRAVHKPEEVAELSAYYLALEVRQTYPGMMIALPAAEWTRFAELSASAWAQVLREVARRVRPTFYRKARRGPKKPAPAKDQYKNGGHVSTHKLLQERKT